MFADRAFAAGCVEDLREIADRSGSSVLAYCLMPDHVHLLVGVDRLPLPAFVQRFKSLTARRWIARYSEASFWQRGYYERALRRSDDQRAAAVYILENPVRAGLVDERSEYPWGGSLVWDL